MIAFGSVYSYTDPYLSGLGYPVRKNNIHTIQNVKDTNNNFNNQIINTKMIFSQMGVKSKRKLQILAVFCSFLIYCLKTMNKIILWAICIIFVIFF